MCSVSVYLFQATDPEVADKIDQFIERLKKLKDVEEEFTLVNQSINTTNAIPFYVLLLIQKSLFGVCVCV